MATGDSSGSIQKVESFLINLGLTYETIEDNAWLITDNEKGLPAIAVIHEDPLVILSIKVMKRPAKNREPFYEELLRLNSEGLLHGAYAIEGNELVLVDTLEHQNLSLEEFQASLDAMGLALAQHYQLLAKYKD